VVGPQLLLASAKDVVFGSVLSIADVHHDEKALAEPCLFADVVASLGNKEGWVQVGRGAPIEGAALDTLKLAIPCCPGVGLRSCPTHHCVQRSGQRPLLGVASLDSTFQSQFVFMRSELLRLVDARVEEAYRPLREKVATLKLLLARVCDSLESTDDEGTTPRVLAFGLPAAAQE
jgi:hypothetical protein